MRDSASASQTAPNNLEDLLSRLRSLQGDPLAQEGLLRQFLELLNVPIDFFRVLQIILPEDRLLIMKSYLEGQISRLPDADFEALSFENWESGLMLFPESDRIDVFSHFFTKMRKIDVSLLVERCMSNPITIEKMLSILSGMPMENRASFFETGLRLDHRLVGTETIPFLWAFPEKDRLRILEKFKANFDLQAKDVKSLAFIILFSRRDLLTVIEILKEPFTEILEDLEQFEKFSECLLIDHELHVLDMYHSDYISSADEFSSYYLKHDGLDVRRAIYEHYEPQFRKLIQTPLDLLAVLECTIEVFLSNPSDLTASIDSIIQTCGDVVANATGLADLLDYSEKPEANAYYRMILDAYQDKIPEMLSQSNDLAKVRLIHVLKGVTLLEDHVLEKVDKLLKQILEEYPPYLQSPPQDSEGFAWLLENLPEKTLLKCVHHWSLKEGGFRFDAALMGPLPKWLEKFKDPHHRIEFFLRLNAEDVRASVKPEVEKKDFDCFMQVFNLLAPAGALLHLVNGIHAEDFYFTFYELFVKIYLTPHVNTANLLIWVYDILSSVQDSRRRDQYWQVVHDILTQAESLKDALQAVLDNFYFLLWVSLVVDQASPAKHLKILFNDPRFSLYTRFRDGTTLEQYLELCAPEGLRQDYLLALRKARESQRLQGVYRLKFPRSEFSLPKDFYGENQPLMRDLSLPACKSWFTSDPFSLRDEPKNRMRSLIDVLKAKFSVDFHAMLETLQENFEDPEFFQGSDNRFYQLQALEAVVATANALSFEQREAWLVREINQFGECPAGVLGALHHLILVNPLASASFVQEQYHLVEGVTNTLVTRYLEETREGYDVEQGVHADVFPVRALCGLEPEKQVMDPNYLLPLPSHIHRALAQEALYQLDQMGGVEVFVRSGSEKFKEIFGEAEIDTSMPEINTEFREKVARNLAPLGLSIGECFDYTDEGMIKLKLKSNFEKVLGELLFEKGIIAYTAEEARQIKRQWGSFLSARPAQRFKEELLGVVQGLLKSPGGLGLLISGLLELAQSEDFADFPVENLLVTLPEYGCNVLEIIAAHPWLGPQLLAGQEFASPQALANGSAPKEAYEPNLQGFLEKFTEDQRSDFMHHLLFLPGGMRTALMFLSEDERWTGSVDGEPAFLDVLNELTQRKQHQFAQFTAIDYSGSLISYLYEHGQGEPLLESFIEEFAKPAELEGELALRHLLALVMAQRNDEAEKLILENDPYRQALLDHFETANLFSRQILASLTNSDFRASLVAKIQAQGHSANLLGFWEWQSQGSIPHPSLAGNFSRPKLEGDASMDEPGSKPVPGFSQ